MPHQDIVAGLYKFADAIRHPAHHLVLTVIARRRVVEGGGHGDIAGKAVLDPFHQTGFPAGQEKFLHVHGIERFHIHLAHGERELLTVDRYPQQTAAGDHMVFRGLLAEVFQSRQRPLAELYLVEDHQGLFTYDGLPRYPGEEGDKITGLNTFVKGPDQAGIGFEIEVGHIFIVFFAKFQQNIGLSYLSCSL